MKAVFFSVFLGIITFISKAQNITGTWSGKLNVEKQEIGIIFHFVKDTNDRLLARMDVPEQGAWGIPVSIKCLTSDSVSLEVVSIKASYTGKLIDRIIKGSFKQYGKPFVLDLMAGDLVRPNRPQEPKEPLGYKTEEIIFINDAAGISFGGTLTYPIGYSPERRVPVVLMITGSGTQNRDEEIFGHKPFLVIADYLARNGIASLRYDDRGAGKSTGTPLGCTSEDFMNDAMAGLQWLKKTERFGKMGILGHSEGGLIAFMIGANNEVDFIISMAGPGIKGDTLLAEQQNAILRLLGRPASRTVKQVREEIAVHSKDAWLDYFLDYDPARTIAKIKIPVMAINGGNDVQVIAATNLSAIKKSLSSGNKKNFIKEYPGLNHLFQHCDSTNSLEYYKIEETCSPEVLQDIVEWINDL